MHFSGNTVENVAKWQNDFDNRESYILENQRIAIFLENVSIPRNYFSLESRIININSAIKNYTVAIFDDEVIQDLL
jgi:hypothetical protein